MITLCIATATPWAGTPHGVSFATSLVWRPSPGVSIQPFWSGINDRNDEVQPLIFTSGAFLPRRIPRNEFFGQKWADFASHFRAYGVVAKANVAGFDLGLGVFRSTVDTSQDHFDLLFDTDQNGVVGDRIVVADKDNFFGSTSGEFKASRTFADGPRRHIIHASIRARSLSRRYGGSDFVDLGQSVTDDEDFRPKPKSNLD